MRTIFRQIAGRLIIISLCMFILTSWLHKIPIAAIIYYALTYIEFLVHEAGHQIAAIILNENSYNIKIGQHGIIEFIENDDIRKFVIFSGYGFVSFIGMILYCATNRIFITEIKIIAYPSVIFIVLVSLLWVRDYSTLIFIFFACVIFLYITLRGNSRIAKFCLYFLSLYFVLSGFTEPYFAMKAGGIKDVSMLANEMHIYEIEAVYLWWIWTAIMLFICFLSDYIYIFRITLIDDFSVFVRNQRLRESDADELEKRVKEILKSSEKPDDW